MKFFHHFALGIIGFAAIVILGFSKTEAAVFALASILIDIDHLAWYFWKFKNLDFLKAKRQFENHELRDFPVFKLFHTLEFWLFTLVLSVLGTVWFFLFLGITFHLMLDFTQVQLYGRKKCAKAKRSWSIIGYLMKSKRKWKSTE